MTGRWIRLHCNENCYGPSPLVIEAIRKISCDANRYPHPDGLPLRTSVSEEIGTSENEIILGHGSSQLIELIARSFLDSQTNCVSAAETFQVFRTSVESANSQFISVPLRDYVYDLDAILNAMNEHTRLVLIANPNNPTGTIVSPSGLMAFLKECPSNIFVVLDEAYGEYVEDGWPSALHFREQFQNVIVLKTFSKIYGLAGLRLGYAVADEQVIQRLNQIRLPFNTSLFAESAGIAALQATDHTEYSRKQNHEERLFFEKELTSLEIRYVPSFTNFVLIFSNRAVQLETYLNKKQILVARTERLGIPDGLRITFGTHEENEIVLEALRQFLNEES